MKEYGVNINAKDGFLLATYACKAEVGAFCEVEETDLKSSTIKSVSNVLKDMNSFTGNTGICEESKGL